MSTDPRLQRWLDHIDGDRSEASLRPLLADNVTFYSPVVYTPQHGIEVTISYLTAADSVFGTGSFDYQRTLMDGDNAMLELPDQLPLMLIAGNRDGVIASSGHRYGDEAADPVGVLRLRRARLT